MVLGKQGTETAFEYSVDQLVLVGWHREELPVFFGLDEMLGPEWPVVLVQVVCVSLLLGQSLRGELVLLKCLGIDQLAEWAQPGRARQLRIDQVPDDGVQL